jgi:GTP cyclohydrolase I
MSVKCGDVAKFMEDLAPLNLAEDWDNVGLLLGNSQSDIRKILVCLDATSEVVDEAIKWGADLIVSHHPLIFEGLKRINSDDTKGRLIYKLIKNNIGVYSAHTNLDFAKEGLNQYLAELLGLKAIKNLRKYKADKLYKNVYPMEIAGEEYGLGKIGTLEIPQNLDTFISTIKEKLKTKYIRLIGHTKNDIINVAVFCGSFDNDWTGVLKEGADVLVTGDIKYHTAMDAIEKDVCVIDAGHFNTESIIVPQLAKLLSEKFSDIEVTSNTVEADPIKIT